MYQKLNANPSNHQQLRLNEIKIKDYFIADIKEIELISERLSKYITFLTILISHYLFF